mmetsp:Transcript_22195/g.43180  ORF Transcript_22195/g.43180 Transcript_22195/m.43180 type:complete len:284 (+) Transcript_22195:129-980(+)|eukprot:CAMPEP_0173404782 /NCGR_PEP_ID=MMETSP1356-20130122/60240_1 /TAXON_ID=77927 ORGANISM="Hemiselmis virescens, Strain PCC157" /NCGR_SAMPLE_ID=MMETSP1356 /ASSEMBLY_ACC=CAM_ASM_000847 /LENGTH=283 /DNA_ID=CAMNT_0014365507 /DNA_START=73 /DNA_END=924 /DNA_ORIENTATION=+
MADDLDAFLDEIDTLDEGGDGAAADAAGSSSSSSAPPATKVPAAAVISQPPVKAEPTRSVYASRPVRNEAPQPEPPAKPEAPPPAPAPVAHAHTPYGGPPPMMPPPMHAPMHASNNPPHHVGPPPVVHHQPPPVIPMQPIKAQPPATEEEQQSEKKRKIMRMAGDKIWKDDSMQEWPEDDYRLFCGNLGNEVDDSTLARTFNKYASFQKARVIRDQRTKKSKGYGFVSLADPADGARAIRELNGKYVGNRPIKLTKSEWQDRQLVSHIQKRPKMKPSSAKKHI